MKKYFNEGKLESQRRIAKNLMDILNDEMISKKCDLSIEEVKEFRREHEENN